MSYQKINNFVAEKLSVIADLEGLYGGNSIWKERAYRKAAETIKNLDIPISNIDDLKTLSGVGESIASTIFEILETGSCSVLQNLEDEYEEVLKARKLMVVPGVGFKTAIKLYNQGITTLDELNEACEEGRVSSSTIKAGIKLALNNNGRIPIYDLLPHIEPLLEYIKSLPGVNKAEFVGSVRRRKETIKDVDILVDCLDKDIVINKFLELGTELVRGEQKARIIYPLSSKGSVQMDLLFASDANFGAAKLYFTGSKEHNVALRKRANKFGYTLNEHCLSSIETGSYIAGKTEKEIYNALKLYWHPPELREGFEFKSKETISNLVKQENITSDWHMHTNWSRDAKSTFEEMAIAAKNRGLKKIGITDHTEIQYGWDPKDIDKRRFEAKKAEQEVGIKIYVGCETGVNPDGTLDWPDEYLQKMDYVIASIHRQHKVDPVSRLIKAIQNPYVKIIGHPTGRILGKRDIPDDDWDLLFKEAARRNILLEINGPRMDLDVNLILRAKSFGCKFVLNSDAHHYSQLEWIRYSLFNARRAGILTTDIAVPE